MKIANKIIVLILALSIIISAMLPLAVLAENEICIETVAEQRNTYIIDNENETELFEKSGNCGDNAVWSLSSDGVLTISGSGDMENYRYPFKPGWIELNVKSVVIENGITSIANNAFSGCSALSCQKV